MAILAPSYKPEKLPVQSTDPVRVLADIYAKLAHAVGDRHQAWRTPTLATLGLDGAPRARTVVLRGADATTHRVRFHSDRRSAKCVELAADPRAALHFYDAAAKTQLRLEGLAVLHCADAVAQAAWQAASPSARRTYAIEPGPGTALTGPDDASFAADAAASFARFCVIEVAILSIDWLYLRVQGHRRLGVTLCDGKIDASWRAP
jgi:pyridoxamine 5'-phosphate oxidase